MILLNVLHVIFYVVKFCSLKMDQSCQSIEKVKILTQSIRQAKNDSQTFAALLAVSKMLKANDLTPSQRKNIFQAVGFSFPFRLLTSEGTEDCPRLVLNELALSMLASFVTDPDLALSSENTKFIPMIVHYIKENCQDPIHHELPLFDCFCYLASITVSDINCSTILKHNGVEILVEAFCGGIRDNIGSMFWSILHHLINFDADTVWCIQVEHVTFLLEYLAEQTCTDFSATKFQVYSDVSMLLASFPTGSAELHFEDKWVRSLQKSLFEVLCSKITSAERNPSLKLCHNLTEIFGLQWTSNDSVRSEKNLAVLLVKLCCVEIRLILHEWLGEKKLIANIIDSTNMPLFIACCAIIETGCSNISDFDFCEENCRGIFTFADINNLKGTLCETVESIAEASCEFKNISELSHLLMCCLRTVGSYLNIEAFALSKVETKFVETIYSIFKVCLKVEPAAAIKAATPAFLHYGCNLGARDCLLNLNIIRCLASTIVDRDIPDETKYLSAQCLILFCVESVPYSGFDEILPAMIDYSLTFARRTALCFYINLLAVMLWNKRCDTVQPYFQKERFFQNLLRLLHQVHSLQDRTNVRLTKE